jgi:hypothetical protein
MLLHKTYLKRKYIKNFSTVSFLEIANQVISKSQNSIVFETL